MIHDNLISDCCGADSQGYEDYGICPECKEHCEFVSLEEDEPENMTPEQLKEIKESDKDENNHNSEYRKNLL